MLIPFEALQVVSAGTALQQPAMHVDVQGVKGCQAQGMGVPRLRRLRSSVSERSGFLLAKQGSVGLGLRTEVRNLLWLRLLALA